MPVNFLFRLTPKNKHLENHFIPSVWNRLCFGSRANSLIASRAVPSSNRFTRWVIIYQNLTTDIRNEYFKLRYTIQDFELPIEENSSLLSVHDRINKKTWYVRKEAEIYEILKRISISPQSFTAPEVCNYPFV